MTTVSLPTAVENFVESIQPRILGEKQRGSIWEVVLIETGPSLNGKFYSRETLQDAVNRGAAYWTERKRLESATSE